MKGMLWSLLPWIVFSVVARALGPESIAWAAAAALVLAVVFLFLGRRGGLKIIDVSGVLTFGILTLVAVVGGPAVREFVADYGRGGCAVLLGLIMAVSVVTVPFTEQYARQMVPREHWGSPLFRAVNRRISSVWAVAVLLMAGCHLIYGYLAATSSSGRAPVTVDLLLNWVIPIGLVFVAITFTKKLSADRPTQPEATTPQGAGAN